MNSRYQDNAVKALAAAVVLGGFIGISSLARSGDSPPEQNNSPVALAHEELLVPGTVRSREPAQGDEWARCDHARAAGTSPIFRGEPGYRSSLDKDGDGVACEPYVEPD